MPELVSRNTVLLLEAWAEWSRLNPGVSLGWSSVTPYARLYGSTAKSPLINDQKALEVEGIVSRLNHRDKEVGSAVILFFFCDQNLSRVARLMKKDRKRVNVLVESGIAWIDATMEAGKKIA